MTRRLPPATLDYLKNGAAKGSRNETAMQAAVQMRDAGYPASETLDILMSRGTADGLGRSEIDKLVKSAYGRPAREPIKERRAAPRLPMRAPTTVRVGGSSVALPRPSAGTADPESPPQAPRATAAPIEPGKGFGALLEAAFKPGEFVAVVDSVRNEDRSWSPGRSDNRTVERWKESTGRLEIAKQMIGEAGAYIILNPMSGDRGQKDADVAAFRHVLVEFDAKPDAAKGETLESMKTHQRRLVEDSMLPVTAIIDSGGKSIHAWVRVDAADRSEWDARREAAWAAFPEGTELDRVNKNPSRLSRCPDCFRTLDDGTKARQTLLAVKVGAKDWEEWETNHGPDALPEVQSIGVFIATPIPEPPQLIKGLLHRGEKMVLGGGAKCRKSWSLIDLAICVSAGAPWWGMDTVKERALYINFELPPWGLQRRVIWMAAERGITIGRDYDTLDVWNLRGRANDLSKLVAPMLARVQRRKYGLVVVDPIYKALGDREENSAGDMTDLMNELERIACGADTAIVFGAHFAKGDATAKAANDRISGSGVFSRDPDSILVMTAHEAPNAYTVDTTTRNFAPMGKFVVQRKEREHLFHRVDLDPEDLAGIKKKVPKESPVPAGPPKPPPPLMRMERGADGKTKWVKIDPDEGKKEAAPEPETADDTLPF